MTKNKHTHRFTYPPLEHENDIDYSTGKNMINYYLEAKVGETLKFTGVNRETGIYFREQLQKMNGKHIFCYFDFGYVEIRKK